MLHTEVCFYVKPYNIVYYNTASHLLGDKTSKIFFFYSRQTSTLIHSFSHLCSLTQIHCWVLGSLIGQIRITSFSVANTRFRNRTLC